MQRGGLVSDRVWCCKISCARPWAAATNFSKAVLALACAAILALASASHSAALLSRLDTRSFAWHSRVVWWLSYLWDLPISTVAVLRAAWASRIGSFARG